MQSWHTGGVSSYAAAFLDDGRPICWFRNSVDNNFLALFTTDEWIEMNGAEAVRFMPDIPTSDARVTGFRTTAAVLSDRLELAGISERVVSSELQRLVEEQIASMERLREYGVDVATREIDFQSELRWNSWVEHLQKALESGEAVIRPERSKVGSASWLMSIWEDHDPRYALRALLAALPRTTPIVLDLADLVDGGWMQLPIDPQLVGRRAAVESTRALLPPIVLVEGRFDVEVISAAMRLRRPHMEKYLRLPDFSQRAEGGAAALRQTVRAFASAGVPNRVLALFDNDAAACDVMRTMAHDVLPPNIQVAQLPELRLARDYPTIGAQGNHRMNVNGLAGSIELYLGADVLGTNDQLSPVQWGGYVRAVDGYQGEVADKSRIHERFRKKVESASTSPGIISFQDWSGLELVIDHILGLLSSEAAEAEMIATEAAVAEMRDLEAAELELGPQ